MLIRIFQSTPPARGATDYFDNKMSTEIQISIHAPREGGDMCYTDLEMPSKISIHAPREGGDRS